MFFLAFPLTFCLYLKDDALSQRALPTFLLCLFSGYRSQQLTHLSVQFTYLLDPHYPRYLNTPCAYKTTFPPVDSKVEPSSLLDSPSV